MAEKKGLNLSARGKAARETAPAGKKKAPAKEPAKESRARAKSSLDVDMSDEEDDDDEELFGGLEEQTGGKSKLLFGVAAVILVVVVIVGFLLFGGKRGNKEPDPPPPTTTQPENPTQSQEDPNQGQTGTGTPAGMGTQDFTGDTNMNAGSVLTNPDEYVEDIYGLTTRVDYTVKRISSVADFVSYEKKRGTWGGGLELYWLDATYKNQKYVVQVPFQYYKELDDVGIVPVKMEVLTISGSAEGEELSVISYMCLDEKTLSDILKNQSKR